MDDQLRNCKYRTIEENLAALTTGITDISGFGSYLVEKRFMTLEAMNGLLQAQGESPSRKVQQLLTVVVSAIKTASTPEACAERFDSFVCIIRDDLQLEDLGQQLLDKCATLEERFAKSQYQTASSESSGTSTALSGSTAIVKHSYLTTEQAEQKCRELKEMFIITVKQMKRYLNSSEENISDFCDDFLLRISSSKIDENMLFFQENADRISNAKTFNALFILLNTFWNYLNYGLLECIIKVKGNRVLKERIHCYAIDADAFQEMTKLHVFWKMDPSLHISLDETPFNPSEFKKMITELSITPESTLKDIEAIRLKVTQKFRLPMFALILAKVEQGSVIVIWFVHKSAVSLLCELSEELKQELNIMSLKIVDDKSDDTCSTGKSLVNERKEPSKLVTLDVASGDTASEELPMQYSPILEGGYDCTFVEPPKELQYECIICRNILRDPCHLDCDCDIRFCYTCIKRISIQKKPCPHCNNLFKSITPDKKLERELGQREVTCNEMKFKLKELYGIRCKFCRCTFKYTSEVPNHEAECGLRPHTCEYCHHYQTNYDDVTLNHQPVCPSRPVPCPNECGVCPEQQHIAHHIKTNCPLTVIDCEYNYAGCLLQLPRQDMPNHLEENIVTHMSLQANYYKRTIESKNQEFEQLKLQIGQLNKQIPGRFEKMQQEMWKEMEPVKAHASKRQQRVSADTFGIDLRCSVFLFTVTVVLISVFIGGYSILNNDYHSDMQAIKEKMYYADSEERFELMDFHELTKSEMPWYSPPFFRKGYKLCLAVATDKGTGTHLSVLVHIMQGEFDDQLKWPFRDNITIQLRNQTEEKYPYEHTIHFSNKLPDSYAGRVLNKDRADLGYGRRKFVSHKELKLHCLKNDTIQFDIKPSSFTLFKQKLFGDTLKYAEKNIDLLERVLLSQNSTLEVLQKSLRIQEEQNNKLLSQLMGDKFILYHFSQYVAINGSWFSRPFYVNGYKMCLKVSTKSPTYISVGIHIMQGEFDDQLKWPFQGELSVQLLNVTEVRKNHERNIIFTSSTPSEIAGRVTYGVISGKAHEIPYFIARSKLGPFLKNDELHFRVYYYY